LRFVVNAFVLGYNLGMNSNARERGSTCVFVYFRLPVAAVCLRSISKLLRMETAWTSEGRYLCCWLVCAAKRFSYSVLSTFKRYAELYFKLKSEFSKVI